MTTTIQSTDLILAASNIWTGTTALETYWLTAGTIAANTQSSGAGIFSNQDTFTALIDGQIFADYNGVYASGPNATISIGATGTVHVTGSPFGMGMTLAGANSTLINAGHLDYSNTVAVFSNALNNHIVNSGTIFGGAGGVYLNTSDGQSVENSGTITAGTSTNTAVDHGHGIIVLSNFALVSNSGLISSNGANGAGIALGYSNVTGYGSNAQIVNGTTGLIRSLQSWGLDASQISASDAGVTLSNAGEISGALGALRGSAADDHIINSGVLIGAVDLGAGTDRLVNTGSILGTVDLGSGSGVLRSSGVITDDVSAGNGVNRIVNSGRMDGNVATDSGTNTVINFGAVGGDVTFLNGTNLLVNHATLEGSVLAHDGGLTLRNLGTVAENVTFGTGASLFINLGTVQGDVSLGSGATTYSGGAGHVAGRIIAGGGAQTITAGSDNDIIQAGGGNDTILGGAGDDDITGGAGIDRLTGGAGADTFHFNATGDIGKIQPFEAITDFSVGSDTIELGFMAGGSFIGAAAFSHTAKEVRYVAATGLLQGDVNGDGKTDWVLQLTDHLVLSVADFTL